MQLVALLEAVLQIGKAPAIIRDPFVGLRAMTEEDAALFFGREDELAELVTKVRDSRLVAVVADSGSGKSSLVRAGLIPRYRGGIFADHFGSGPDERIWHVVVMRPGVSPLTGLRMAVTTAAEQLNLSVREKSELRNALDFSKGQQTAFALQCNLPAATTETLLVVDQFEELFTQTPLAERKPFIEWLLSLITSGSQPRLRVVLTLRSDHFNLSSSHKDLFGRLSQEGSRLNLRPISEKGLSDIVQRSLALAGRTDRREYEALVRQIGLSLSDRAGDLALVQVALYEAWRRREQHDDNLVNSFIAVGAVSGALANVAEDVRTRMLNTDQQRLLEAVLVRLVVLGETAGATRRTARLEEFGPPESEKRQLIDQLADGNFGRLLLTGPETVEICHEQLVTQWPWWQEWINIHAFDMRCLSRLTGRTREWKEASTKKSELLAGGADLSQWTDVQHKYPHWLSGLEEVYLREGRRNAAKSQMRKFITIAAVLAFAALTAFYYRDASSKKEESFALAQAASSQYALQQGSDLEAIGTAADGLKSSENSLTRSAMMAALLSQPPRLQHVVNVVDRLAVLQWREDDGKILVATSRGSSWMVDYKNPAGATAGPQIPPPMLETSERIIASFSRQSHPAVLSNHGRILVVDDVGNWLADAALGNGDFVPARNHALSLAANGRSTLILSSGGRMFHQCQKTPGFNCYSIPDGQENVSAISHVGSGGDFAYGTENGSVFLRDGHGRREIIGVGSGPILALNWGASGNLLAVSSREGGVRLVKLDCSKNCINGVSFEADNELKGVTILKFSPDGSDLALVAGEVLCVIRIAISGTGTFSAHQSYCEHSGTAGIRQLEWSPTGLQLASLSDDALLKIWSVEEVSDTVTILDIPIDARPLVALNRDGDHMIAFTDVGDVQTIHSDLQGTIDVKTFHGDRPAIKSAALLREGGPAVVRSDGSFGYWSMDSLDFVRLDIRDNLVAHRIAAIPQRARYAVSLRDGRIALFDPITGSRVLTEPGSEQAAWGLVYNEKEGTLLASFADGSIKKLRADNTWADDWLISPNAQDDGQPLGQGSLAITADGQLLATTAAGSRVDLYSLRQTPPKKKTYRLYGGESAFVDIDPTGKWLMAMDAAHRLYIWDLAANAENPFATIGPSVGSAERMQSLVAARFSSDGTRLLIAFPYSILSLKMNPKGWVTRGEALKVHRIEPNGGYGNEQVAR
ncbi:WD40 repeat domain-containing protein [Rhizobium leguminosarum]|uniref:WD40 repeat domain-containing protein n=1 Tax=Rhizobium leguminosarum TaxID=384 RepID=UPI003F9B6229